MTMYFGVLAPKKAALPLVEAGGRTIVTAYNLARPEAV